MFTELKPWEDPRLPSYCAKCGHERRRNEYTCPDCLRNGHPCSTYHPDPPPGVVPPDPADPVAGPLGGAGYKLPPGRLLLLYGPRGEGKTGLSHVTLPGADVVGREMDTRSVREYQRGLGVPLGNCYAPTWDPYTDEVTTGGWRSDTRDVIVDSASDFERPRQLVEEVAHRLDRSRRRGIVICWETQAGTAWGGSDLGHLVWAVGRVVTDALGKRSVTIEKNRSGPTMQVSFLLPWDRGHEPSPCLYSVEGSTGRYKLAPWPHEVSATRADVWRHGEGDKLDLPAAPCAAAAKRLPGGGWSEPPDWRRRSAYARSAGVPYFSPLFGLLEV